MPCNHLLMAVSIHLIETAYVAVHNDLIHSIHVNLLRDLDRCMLTVFCTWQIICCHWPICSVVPVCLAGRIQSVSHDNSHISSFLVSSSVPEGSVLGHIQTPTLMMLSKSSAITVLNCTFLLIIDKCMQNGKVREVARIWRSQKCSLIFVDNPCEVNWIQMW